jgi:citrate lyase beta subunit
MYVPASQEKMMRKAAAMDVDCIVMDCEDAVSLNRKVK